MRFIVVDGLDAAGKDTHALLIKRRYEKKGEKGIIRSHPSTDNMFGYQAKKALLEGGKLSKTKASIFFALDVFYSLINYYGKADTVIFVRYLCGIAYLPRSMVKKLYTVCSKIFPTSNYMFFLDVDPDEALRRVEDEREETEIFENKKDLIKVKKKALSMVEDWHRIDTTQPIPQARKEIEDILEKEDRANGFIKRERPDKLETANEQKRKKKIVAESEA